ncbi:mitochondrial carrier domain-containing protein [Pyronema domesticum]|nr:mitochondrial carrier domain-containing protein [Pyronema domesticum]
MVRYNNDLDEYSSYYHADSYSEPNSEYPPSHRSDLGEGEYFPRSAFALPSREHVMPLVGHAAAGAVGSALANVATYPLDVVSTRLKVQRYALAQRAQRTRAKTKKYLSDSSSDEEPKGIFNVSREEAKGYKKYVQETEGGSKMVETWEYEYDEEELYDGHLDAVKKIWEREGIAGFYHGVGWDTLGTVFSGAGYIVAYNLLRKQRLHILGQPNSTQLPIMEELGIGIAAAALSKFIAAPMSNIVTRKQTAAMLYPNAKAPSTARIYHDIMREKGVSGLWSGYRASLLLTLNPSITFLLYEYCKPHYMKHKGHMGKFDTFILAALCKAAATALTYPMNIVRIRKEMDDSTEEWETMYGHPKYGNEKKVCIDSVTDRYRSSSSSKYRVAVRQASGIVGLLAEIVKKEGISALYIGLAGSVAKGFAHHTVNTLVKENVHRYIIRLYWYVLDAYNHHTHHSIRHHIRDKAVAKTLVAAHAAGHAVGKAKQKLESAGHNAEGVTGHVAHAAEVALNHATSRTKETAHHVSNHAHSAAHSAAHNATHNVTHALPHHNHNHNHNHNTSRHSVSEADTLIEETGRSTYRPAHENELFEEHFAPADRERIERTSNIQETHFITPRGRDGEYLPAISNRSHHSHHSNHGHNALSHHSHRSVREEMSAPPLPPAPVPTPAILPAPAPVAASAASLVGTPHLTTGKSLEKVANWRERVAEEMMNPVVPRAAPAPAPMVSTRHEQFTGSHGELVDRTTTVKESHFVNGREVKDFGFRSGMNGMNGRGVPSREPSLASGNSSRTSMMVNVPASTRGRVMKEEWSARSGSTQRSVLEGGEMRRVEGGDVGVNGGIRRSGRKGL